MTLPASNKDGNGIPQNSISFGEIETEFGQNTTRSLGKYRTNKVYGAFNSSNAGVTPVLSSPGRTFPLSTNAGLNANQDIPTSGQIRFSDFYSGKRTVLIDAYSVDDTDVNMLTFGATNKYYLNYTMTARDEWTNGNRVRVGDNNIPMPAPSSPENTRVIVYINKWLTGTHSKALMAHPQEEYVAFRTGVWPASTELEVIVGDQGRITGGGGKGGDGGSGENDGTAGRAGTSAFGADNNVTVSVKNGGIIYKGFGGGGGGGGYYTSTKGFLGLFGGSSSQTGGGGGGGAGVSIQGASSGGTGENAGGGGAWNNGGAAGGGAGESGDGGDGGGAWVPPNSIDPEAGDDGNQTGGGAGANGKAFRRTSGAIITFNNETSAFVPDTSTTIGTIRMDT